MPRALLPPFRPKTGGLFLQSRAPFTAYDLTFWMIRIMAGPDAVNKTREWDIIPHVLKNSSIDAFTGTICLNSFTFAGVGGKSFGHCSYATASRSTAYLRHGGERTHGTEARRFSAPPLNLPFRGAVRFRSLQFELSNSVGI